MKMASKDLKFIMKKTNVNYITYHGIDYGFIFQQGKKLYVMLYHDKTYSPETLNSIYNYIDLFTKDTDVEEVKTIDI